MTRITMRLALSVALLGATALTTVAEALDEMLELESITVSAPADPVVNAGDDEAEVSAAPDAPADMALMIRAELETELQGARAEVARMKDLVLRGKAHKHYQRFLELAPHDVDAGLVYQWLISLAAE